MRARARTPLLVLLVLAACDAPTEPDAETTRFVAEAVLEIPTEPPLTRWEMSGILHLFESDQVYREESSAGVVERPIVLLNMASEGPDGRQISFGLLVDRVVSGIYRVRRTGTTAEGLQFYGSVLGAVEGDGSRLHHRLEEGTLTIESVRPLRGHFNVRSSSFFREPSRPSPGDTFTHEPGSLQVEGRFGKERG